MLLFTEFMSRMLNDALCADMLLAILTKKLKWDFCMYLAHLQFFSYLIIYHPLYLSFLILLIIYRLNP